MRITRKLTVLATVPLIAVLVFAALALRTTAGQALDGERLRRLVALAAQAGDLTHQLADERSAAAAVLTAGSGADQTNAFLEQTRETDASLAKYRQLRARLPGDTMSLLDEVDQELVRLPSLRSQVQGGSGTLLSAVTFEYRIMVADLLAYRGDVAEAGKADAATADRINSAVALSRAQEYAGQQEVAVLRALAAGQLSPAAQAEITATRTGYTESVLEFGRTADPDWQSWLARALTGDAVIAARQQEDAVGRTAPGGKVPVDGSWTAVMDARLDLVQGVEARVDQSVLADVTHARDNQRRWALGEMAGVLLVLLGVALLAFRMGRPMIRELRRLRDAAHAVANERLPDALAELTARGALGPSTPEEYAAAAGDAVRVRGKDEIAEVGAAFNTVSREAVRIAAEQAAMRDRVGTVFVGLARRAERLTGALMKALDTAQRDEQDPARLEKLFALDHLATRMSRNNHSLLVLGGEATARVRDHDAPVEDVLRAAMSQIERYTRVDFGTMDAGILVHAKVIDHLVHLFAELLDNATAYSGPECRVTAEARYLGDRVVVQIRDDGLGLTEQQLVTINSRLAEPPPVEVAAVRAMGLTVVGHIAAWYGIRVELRPRPGGGTIAEVTLPDTLFTVAPPEPPALPAVAPVLPESAEPVPAVAVPVTIVTDGTTPSGLPRRSRAKSAAETPAARPHPEQTEEPRDPGRVSAVMSAYARGIGASRAGRGAPKPLLSETSAREEA